MMQRIFEVWIGAQSSGKTYALRRRVEALSQSDRVSSIWILDVTGEWAEYYDYNAADVIDSWAEWDEVSSDYLPRIVVFSHADRWVTWKDLVSRAQGQGRVAIVIDEAYWWLPAKSTIDEDARRAILAGRHLPALDRELYPLHILAAAQYPRSVHHLLLDQASTVIVGEVRGELTRDWIRGDFGKAAIAKVDRLGPHEFVVLRGKRPKAEKVRWQE